MNIYTEAKAIAQEALEQTQYSRDDAEDFINETCDGHEVVIYYHKAIEFCAMHNTDDGEQWLEDCGGIAHKGDSFGMIACRIAYATLLMASLGAMEKMLEEREI